MKNSRLAAIVCVFLLLLGSCVTAMAFYFPDSGQTSCYQPENPFEWTDCRDTGQDGEYTINPPSYYNTPGGGAVVDINTGLMWQKEDNDSEYGEKFFYDWYQASGTYHEYHNPDRQSVCGALRAEGYQDWRLPTKKELLTVVNYLTPSVGPLISTDFFPSARQSLYWTSTTTALYPTSYAWYVDFYSGNTYWRFMTNEASVRCVRGGQFPLQALVDNGNGTVTDNATELTWQQVHDYHAKSWVSALSYCEGLSLGGNSGWRVPNIKELDSLVDEQRKSYAINLGFFPNTPPTDFWSSTTFVNGFAEPNENRAHAFGVHFGSGHTTAPSKTYDTKFVRCVRTGQGGSTDTYTASLYNVANIDARSDHFTVWFELLKNGQPTDQCGKVLVIADSGGRRAVQRACSVSGWHKVTLQITSANQPNERARYIENVSFYLCNGADDNVNTCAQISGIPADFSVYGTSFDVRTHAFNFENTEWVGDAEAEKSVGRAVEVVNENILDRLRFLLWDLLFPTWGSLSHTEGVCYGMANSAIANFNHRGETSWGYTRSDATDREEWRNAIVDHWPAGEARPSTFKPFSADNINSDVYETYRPEKHWKVGGVRKAIYYHVAQPSFSSFPFASSYWVGEDAKAVKFSSSSEAQVINDLLKQGRLVSFGFSYSGYWMHDTGEYTRWYGGHQAIVTELITWDNHRKYVIHDNYYPQYVIEQAWNGPADNRQYGYYLEWYVDDAADYPGSGQPFISFVRTSDGNGGYKKSWQLSSVPDYLQPGCATDSQNIYDLWDSSCLTAGARATLLQAQEQAEPPVDNPTPDHIRVLVVGAGIDSVTDSATSQLVYPIPNGEIVAGQAVITAGTLVSILYLPADGTYRVDITGNPHTSMLKAYVTIPNTDGTEGVVNYEHLDSGMPDAAHVYFFAGRGNTDKAARRSAGGTSDTYLPDSDSIIDARPLPPQNLKGIMEAGTVTLTWNNISGQSLDYVLLIRKTGGYPASTSDGDVVYQGGGESATDTGIVPGSIYYYAAYSVSGRGVASNPVFLKIDTLRFSIHGTVALGSGAGVQSAPITVKDAQGIILDVAATGIDGLYSLPNLPNGDYTLEATHASSDIASPVRTVTINGGNMQQDFTATLRPTLSILFDQPRVVVDTSVYLPWAYRNVGNGETVSVTLYIGGVPQVVQSGIPIINGRIQWTAGQDALGQDVTFRFSLDSDPSTFTDVLTRVVWNRVKRLSSATVYRYTITEAYNEALTSDIVLVRSDSFPEDLTFDRPVSFTLKGGYDEAFTSNAGGYSNIYGTVSVGGSGNVIIENIVIR